FYVDEATSTLSYMARTGETMATADVEAPVLPSIVVIAGTPGHSALVNQNDPAATYTGAWATATNRGYGDWMDDVAYATAEDATLSFAFHGSGVDVLGETNGDEGSIDVTVTKQSTSAVVAQQTISANSAERLAQQTLYSIGGLAVDDYRVTLK